MINDDVPKYFFIPLNTNYIYPLSSCWVLVGLRPNDWCSCLDPETQQHHGMMPGSWYTYQYVLVELISFSFYPLPRFSYNTRIHYIVLMLGRFFLVYFILFLFSPWVMFVPSRLRYTLMAVVSILINYNYVII